MEEKVLTAQEEVNALVEKGLKGCVITNNGTFSSGKIAVCRFKEYAGAVVVGEATGGAVKSFGEAKNFKIGGKRFSCSTKLFDFTNVWGYTGSIQPDIFVLETIEDIGQNRDIQLIKTIEYIKTL